MDHPTTPVPCSIMNNVRSVWYVLDYSSACPSLTVTLMHTIGIYTLSAIPFPACLGGLKRPPIPYRYWHARSTTYKLYVAYHAAFLSSSCWLCQKEDFICPFVETKTSRIRGLPLSAPRLLGGPMKYMLTLYFRPWTYHYDDDRKASLPGRSVCRCTSRACKCETTALVWPSAHMCFRSPKLWVCRVRWKT